MIYKLMTLGHIIGDFYAQSEKTSKEKELMIKPLVKHSFYYGISIFLSTVIIIRPEEILRYVGAILLCIISHGIIDYFKTFVNGFKKYKLRHKEVIIFIIDQILHIISLYYIFYFMKIKGSDLSQFMGITIYVEQWHDLILLLICILICARPTSIFIKMIFKSIFNPNYSR